MNQSTKKWPIMSSDISKPHRMLPTEALPWMQVLLSSTYIKCCCQTGIIKDAKDRITNPVFSVREVTGQEGHEVHVQGSAFPTALAARLSQVAPQNSTFPFLDCPCHFLGPQVVTFSACGLVACKQLESSSQSSKPTLFLLILLRLGGCRPRPSCSGPWECWSLPFPFFVSLF